MVDLLQKKVEETERVAEKLAFDSESTSKKSSDVNLKTKVFEICKMLFEQ